MGSRVSWKSIKDRTLSATLFALVAQLFLFPVSEPFSQAVDAPNFKAHIENSLSATANSFYIYNTNTKTKSTITFDSSGNISQFLANGEYIAVLFPNIDESNSRVSSNFRFSINGGSLTSFVRVNNYLNDKPNEGNVTTNGSGYYQ
jgi:hypothetical protein